MAKNDPAFLFYPADASEDTQFMNRLERGCYFDLMKAHKKFPRYTLDVIKKVLGRDFEVCWPAIEAIIKQDENGYFIEWVDASIEKRKVFSKIQSDRIKDFHKRKSLENDTVVEPNLNHGSTNVEPLGNGNGIVIVNEKIGVQGKEKPKPKNEPKELIYPFDTEKFKSYWGSWIDYKKKQHKFTFASTTYEQVALNALAKDSDYSEAKAIAIILHTVANGWKGFVVPKTLPDDHLHGPPPKTAKQVLEERRLADEANKRKYEQQ